MFEATIPVDVQYNAAAKILPYLYFYPDRISLYALFLQVQIIICQNVETPKPLPVVKQRSADEFWPFHPLCLAHSSCTLAQTTDLYLLKYAN